MTDGGSRQKADSGTSTQRWSLPRHLGRARTSTLLMIAAFLGTAVLYMNVKPEPAGTIAPPAVSTTTPVAPAEQQPATSESATTSTTETAPTTTSSPGAEAGTSGVDTSQAPTTTPPALLPPWLLPSEGTAETAETTPQTTNPATPTG